MNFETKAPPEGHAERDALAALMEAALRQVGGDVRRVRLRRETPFVVPTSDATWRVEIDDEPRPFDTIPASEEISDAEAAEIAEAVQRQHAADEAELAKLRAVAEAARALPWDRTWNGALRFSGISSDASKALRAALDELEEE